MRTNAFAAAALVICVTAHAQVLPRSDGFNPLVAADSVKGWVIEHPGENRVMVTQGTMVLSEKAGMVYTERSGYGNSIVRFDVRVMDDSADAILALFGSAPPKAHITALAVPLLHAAVAHADKEHFPTVTLNPAGVSHALKADREWQSYEVSRREAVLIVRLNGDFIAQEQLALAQDGWIGIRTIGGRIAVRNFQFQSVPAPSVAWHGDGDFPGAFLPRDGATLPTLVREVKPFYTSEAMRARIQGMVLMECVVQPDGSVGDVRIVRSIDSRYGLDDSAVQTAKQWRFRPGTKDGVAVPVIITIQLTFTLK